MTTSPVKLRELFEDDDFLSESSFLLREFYDDLEE